MISFKLLTEADKAIHSVAFFILKKTNKDFASSVTVEIIDKVSDKLKNLIENLNESVSATKGFLDATTQQNALELVLLPDLIKQHADLAKSPTDTSEKLI